MNNETIYNDRIKTQKPPKWICQPEICRSCFFSGIAEEITEDEIFKQIKNQHNYDELEIIAIKLVKTKSGKSRGFGFVEFSSIDQREKMQGKLVKLRGQIVELKKAQKFKEVRKECNLKVIIKNLPLQMSGEDLRLIMRRYWTLKDCFLISGQNPSKKIACAEFFEEKSVDECLKMRCLELQGWPLFFEKFVSKEKFKQKLATKNEYGFEQRSIPNFINPNTNQKNSINLLEMLSFDKISEEKNYPKDEGFSNQIMSLDASFDNPCPFGLSSNLRGEAPPFRVTSKLQDWEGNKNFNFENFNRDWLIKQKKVDLNVDLNGLGNQNYNHWSFMPAETKNLKKKIFKEGEKKKYQIYIKRI